MDEINTRRGKWLPGILISFGVIVGVGGYIALPCGSIPFIAFGTLCIVIGILLPRKRRLIGLLLIASILCLGVEFYLLTFTDLCWFPTPTPSAPASSLSSFLLDSNDGYLVGPTWSRAASLEEELYSEISQNLNLCRLDCTLSVWTAKNGSLITVLDRYENATKAEAIIQVWGNTYKDEMGFQQRFLPHSFYLPEHAWFGTLFTEEEGFYLFVSQEYSYVLSMMFTINIDVLTPSEIVTMKMDDAPQITVLLGLANDQWAKIRSSD